MNLYLPLISEKLESADSAQLSAFHPSLLLAAFFRVTCLCKKSSSYGHVARLSTAQDGPSLACKATITSQQLRAPQAWTSKLREQKDCLFVNWRYAFRIN
ncbi:hypothetical protein M513_11962 [Trichuris suis]|uniref:Uncharacterized protein n=1 Tax=Trichuris suis TaxID=68888 RepID=A0A085LQA7_9BILA|nr:hypothetical protein M513_11962 [Trichuris suis]